MKLRDRFGLAHNPAPAAEPEKEPVLRVVSRTRSTPAERSYQDLKLRIHRDLIDRIDLGNIARTDLASANAELRVAIGQLIEEQAVPLSQRDREQLGEEILNEVHGLGPIEPLLRDRRCLRHPGQHGAPGLRRAGRQARADRRGLPRRRRTCCRSSIASSRGSAGASTSRRRWWTPACPTARASTPSSRRSRSTARCSPSAASDAIP